MAYGGVVIHIPVSIGELIDKITVLEIKIERICDQKKKENCKREHRLLTKIAQKNGFVFQKEKDRLKNINEKLWGIEDKIRRKELLKEFDDEFNQLARQVYRANDLRARIKREINIRSGSKIVEEKQYIQY